MKSKILAFILACSLCLSVLAFPVSASPVSDVFRNGSRFYSAVYKDFVSFKNGDISLSDFLSRYAENAKKLIGSNISDLTCITDVLRHLESLGIDIPFEWSEFMGGGGSGGNRDDSVLNGYSCALFMPVANGQYVKIYGIDGIFYKNGQTRITSMYEYYPTTDYSVDNRPDGVYKSEPYNPTYLYYGDWRYEDGTSADDQTTDLPEKEIPNYDDPDVSEDDLIDFLEDLLQDLMLQYPDMSTIEGLLASILNKLDTLDSDNDNALLSDILTAIQALKSNGETSDNSDLVKTLEDLKNALIFKDGDNVSSLAQMLNDLVKNQVRRSDITIDPSLYNQRFALIQAKLLGKFSFISSFKSLIDYSIEKYSTSSGSPLIHFNFNGKQYSLDFSMFDNYIDPFRWLLAAFIYLSYVFKTFRKIPGYINGGDNS